MKDVDVLLKFVETHPEMRTSRPSEEVDVKRLNDLRLVRAISHLKRIIHNRLIRTDTGAPRVPVLNAIERCGWNVRPTKLTATGWLGGMVQTRVGRIVF